MADGTHVIEKAGAGRDGGRRRTTRFLHASEHQYRRPLTDASQPRHRRVSAGYSTICTAVRAARLPPISSRCVDCGISLGDRRRRYCDRCREIRWNKNANRGRAVAGEVLARLRAGERDPAHGGQAAIVRGRQNAAHQKAVREWVGPRSDPEEFRRAIFPGLRTLTIASLQQATGLSPHYCSLIRLGKRIPHVRHWQALASVSEVRSECG